MPPKNHFKSRGLKYLYQERHAHQIFMVEFGLDSTNGIAVAHNLFGRMYNEYYSKKQRQAYGVSTVRDEWRSRDKATKPVQLWQYVNAGVYTQAELDMRDKLRKLIFYYAAQSGCNNYLVTGPMTPIQVMPVAGSLAETLLQTQGLPSIMAEAAQLLTSTSLPNAAGDGLEDEERSNGGSSGTSRAANARNDGAPVVDLTQGGAASPIDLTQDDAASQVETDQDNAEVQLGFNPYDTPPLNDPQDHVQQQQAKAKGWGGLYDADEGEFLSDFTLVADADLSSNHLNYVPSDLDEGDGDQEDQEQESTAPPLQTGDYFFGKHDFSELRRFREQHAAEFPNFAGGSADEW